MWPPNEKPNNPTFEGDMPGSALSRYNWLPAARYYRLRLTAESMAKAKECFERALTIDLNYAAAHSGLAGYYHALAVLGTKPSGDIAPLAKSVAEKALAVDPANSEAHSVLTTVAAIFDYDWKVAETHFRKALAAEPVTAMCLAQFRAGLAQEAIASFQRGIKRFCTTVTCFALRIELIEGGWLQLFTANRKVIARSHCDG